MVRKLVLLLIGIFGGLLLFVLFSVLPIDRSSYKEKEFYSTMMKGLDTLEVNSYPSSAAGFSVGYAKLNLTPAHHISQAGYGNKRGRAYESIGDSIFVRTMVIDNGSTKVALVTADLLLMPPAVTMQLEKDLPEIGFSLENTYLGATHTHNSIGNWGKGAISFLYGDYNDSIVHFISGKIKECILLASKNRVTAEIRIGHFPVANAVYNRLDEKGGVDSLVRVMEVIRSDSSKLLFLSYTAHATCLTSDDMQLSRDYPGKLVDALQANGYSFAMFMAGAVGSHGCNPPERGDKCIDWMANIITQKFLQHRNELTPVVDSTLVMSRVPLALSAPHARISKDWQLRPWIFHAAFGHYPVSLTALRIGNLVMLGAPCDFSGEFDPKLDSLGNMMNTQVMVTSFNGGYIGYITPRQYYDVDHYETRLMNWYGLGSGEYMTEAMEKLMVKVGKVR